VCGVCVCGVCVYVCVCGVCVCVCGVCVVCVCFVVVVCVCVWCVGHKNNRFFIIVMCWCNRYRYICIHRGSSGDVRGIRKEQTRNRTSRNEIIRNHV